jgi:endonuclease/exonuclease/phosphatase family metal-dependent hydrolase
MRGIACLSVFALVVIAGFASEVTQSNTVRVISYNIHHGQGTDGKVDLQRIAALIKAEKADIVALQEVDRGTLRTTRRDLPAELAKLTGMNVCFDKNIDYQGGEYGNVILSRFPIVQKTNTHYQMLSQHEQRGLLQVVLDVDGRKLLFMSTHLDYHNDDAERALDVKTIKAAWASNTNVTAILCGDFNEGPGSRTYGRLGEFMTDTWKKAGKGSGFTFSSGAPWERIDYIWYSGPLRPLHTWIPKSIASDHLPLAAEFSLE